MAHYQRDKLISVRVNARLLNEVKKIIDNKTEVYEGYGGRKLYTYHDSKRPNTWDKFTIADLLEEKLEEYINEQSPSAQK